MMWGLTNPHRRRPHVLHSEFKSTRDDNLYEKNRGCKLPPAERPTESRCNHSNERSSEHRGKKSPENRPDAPRLIHPYVRNCITTENPSAREGSRKWSCECHARFLRPNDPGSATRPAGRGLQP